MPPPPLRTKPAHKAPRARPDPMDHPDPAVPIKVGPVDLAAQVASAQVASAQVVQADPVGQAAGVAPARSSKPSIPIAMA